MITLPRCPGWRRYVLALTLLELLFAGAWVLVAAQSNPTTQMEIDLAVLKTRVDGIDTMMRAVFVSSIVQILVMAGVWRGARWNGTTERRSSKAGG